MTKVSPDHRKRPRLRTVAAAVALLGVAVTAGLLYPGSSVPVTFSTTPLSPLAAGNEAAATSSAPTVATAAAPQAKPGGPTLSALHPKDVEFERLTALDATPAMLSQAFALARDCRNEELALTSKQHVQTSPLSEHRCQLAPGRIDNATMRRMLEARVQRADFGAWTDVLQARAAFDDPARWRQLVAEAYRIGKANAEPSVMAAEFQSEFDRAEALRASGQAAEAQAAYRQAAIYAVASAVGTGVENKQAIDPSKDRSFASVAPKLASAEQTEVITAGLKLARNWRRPS
jgi:hypothetical protein